MISSIQHPMLDNTPLGIQVAVPDLKAIWLWLKRMRAAEMHVVGCWLCGARAAVPMICVVDAHLTCAKECTNVLLALAE